MVALLFFVCTFESVGWGAKPPDLTRETLRKAEELILAGERTKALEVLRERLDQEVKGSSSANKLASSMKEFSTLFLSDKAQGSYELAESLYFSGSADATSKYREAVGLESDNVLVLLGLARSLLADQNCSDARDVLRSAEKVNPTFDGVGMLSLLAARCLGDEEEAGRREKEAQSWASLFEPYVRQAHLRRLVDLKQVDEAEALAKKVIESVPDSPEANLLVWRVDQLREKPNVVRAQRYLDFCRPGLGKMRKKFKWDPQVCSSIAQIQTFLRDSKTKYD